jgi:hypothetical protein
MARQMEEVGMVGVRLADGARLAGLALGLAVKG